MTVTCCAAVYPWGTLWSLADCCKSARHLTTSQWQNCSCSGEGVLLFTCLFPLWGSVIKVRVHLLDDRSMLHVIGTAGYKVHENTTWVALCATNTESRTICICVCNSIAAFWQIFLIKLCKSSCGCKQAPEKCRQIAPSLPITSANCLGFKINPPKLAPFAP